MAIEITGSNGTAIISGGGGGSSESGVESFNGRTGEVVPQAGDYTAEQVNALPLSGGKLTGNLSMGKSLNMNGNRISLCSGTPAIQGISDTATIRLMSKHIQLTAAGGTGDNPSQIRSVAHKISFTTNKRDLDLDDVSTENDLSEHNTSETSHSDIREIVTTKQNKITSNPQYVAGFDNSGNLAPVLRWSNPNLLDNWYFAYPVNQKNMTEYTEYGYTIDRWKASGFSLFKLSDSGITIAPKSDIRAQFQQIFEDPKMFYGREFTYSFFVDGQPYSQTVSLPENPSYPIDTTSTIMDGMKLYLYQASATSMLSVGLRIEIGSAAKTVFAAKLEFGAQQTIAHQDASGTWVLNDPPPDKALELAKCQRYYEDDIFFYGSAVSSRFIKTVPFKVTKRVIPTCKIRSIDGTTNAISYYSSGKWINYIPPTNKLGIQSYPYGVKVICEGIPVSEVDVGFVISADADL